MNIIHMIVDRQSILSSDQEICRSVIQKLKGGMDTYLSLPRTDRITFLKMAIARIRQNQSVYDLVVKAVERETYVPAIQTLRQ